MVKIDGYTIDLAISEEYSYNAEVTEFPIEKGGLVTDNVRLTPFVYTLRGIVSNSPLEPIASLRDPNVKPIEEARSKFKTIFATPITVVSSRETLTNMVMTSLSYGDDAGTGDALTFNITFRQIQIEEVTKIFVRAVLTGQRKKDLGNKIAGFIGNDRQGRQIAASKLGPGVEPIYTREDGTKVSTEEAREAAKKSGSVLTKYDSNGRAIPVDNRDYQPYTPKQKTSFWTPDQPRPTRPHNTRFGS